MNSTTRNRKSVLASKFLVAVVAGALALMAPAVMAQQHGGGGKGGGGGHDGGSGTSHTSGDDGHSSHESGGGKGGKKGGQEAGRGKGSGGSSLRDVFREMEDEAAAERGKKGPPQGKGPSAEKSKGSDQATKGKKPDAAVAEEEESDRPEWAGKDATKPDHKSTESGTKKGDIYGDLYIIVRDADGAPILDEDGLVQVYYKDASGTYVCCIDRDEAGDLTTNSTPLDDGTVVSGVLPVEVELGRLSVGRSPEKVLSAQLMDAIAAIEASTTPIKTDAAGRIVVTVDGEERTIDSPLANLALYDELLTTGTIKIEQLDENGDVIKDEDGNILLVDLSGIGIDANDGLTSSELLAAASFFAAASDKSIPITIDSVIYMNSILGLDEASYDSLATYLRSSEYDVDDAATVLQSMTVPDPDDDTKTITVWQEVPINPYEDIFNSTEPTDGAALLPVTIDADQNDALTAAEAFTQAAEDARTVIDYLHTYSAPDTN